MVNSPSIRPYLLEVVALGGGTLDSHEKRSFSKGIQLLLCRQDHQKLPDPSQYLQEVDQQDSKGILPKMVQDL